MTTSERIQKSWNVRSSLIDGILKRGQTIVDALKLAPDMGDALTHEKWKAIVAQELDEARKIYGNGEPILSEQELNTLAIITFPRRGW